LIASPYGTTLSGNPYTLDVRSLYLHHFTHRFMPKAYANLGMILYIGIAKKLFLVDESVIKLRGFT
jgi:hypothetical protein